MRVLLVLALVAAPLHAQGMTRANWLTYGASVVATTADCATTVHAVRLGATEVNPLLGTHPTANHVWAVCTVGSVVSWAFGRFVLAPKERSWFWGVLAGIEVGETANNAVNISTHLHF